MQYKGIGREGEDISNCPSDDSLEEGLWRVVDCLRLIITVYFDSFKSSRYEAQITKAQSPGFSERCILLISSLHDEYSSLGRTRVIR